MATDDTERWLAELDLTDLDRFANGFPHADFTRLRAERPVWRHPPSARTPGGEPFWVVTRHADIVAVAADATTFSSDRGGVREAGGTLIEDLPAGFATGVLLNMMDDPRHQRIRRLVTPSVSPRALAAMEPDLRARAAAIVDAAVARGECDFLVDVAAELPLQAIATLLGVPQSDRHDLLAWANVTLDYDDHDLGEATTRTQDAAAAMAAYAGQRLAACRAAPGDDMLSAFVHGAVVDADGTVGSPSELEQQMFFSLLVAAGSETTRNSIAAGVLALAEHPEQWAALAADRALLPSAVEEVLRWASSTSYNRRTAATDAEIAGVPVAAGEKVTLWWSSANRDGAVFADPFRFDVRRDPNRHLAFGHGAHFCLGANLARLEISVMLEALLDRGIVVEPTGPPEWVRSNKHTGLRHVPVRLHPGELR